MRGTTIGRIVFLLWVLTVTGVCTRVALTRTPGRQDVFPVYQNAGRCWLAGQDLYHHAKFDYRYSPTFAAALAPAAFLSPKLGSIAWRLLSIGIFLTALAWSSRVEIPDKFAREGRPFIFFFVLPLALGNLNNGQANLFVIGALLASIAAVTCDRWSFAAVALVAAASIKLYPLVFALLLILLFPRKLGWRVTICLAVAAGSPFLLQRPDYVARQCHHWFQYLQTEDRSGLPLSEWYSDLRLLFRVWLVPLSTTGYLIIQIASGAALAGLAVWGRLHDWPRRNLLGWLLSLTCCWMTVLGPATESSTYVLIAPAVAWITSELVLLGGRLHEWIWATLIYALQLLAGIAGWFGGMKRFGIYFSPLALSALLLAAYLLRPAIFRRMNAVASARIPTDHQLA